MIVPATVWLTLQNQPASTGTQRYVWRRHAAPTELKRCSSNNAKSYSSHWKLWACLWAPVSDWPLALLLCAFFLYLLLKINCHLTYRNNWAKGHSAKGNVCYICVHSIAATKAQASRCSVFRSSNSRNSRNGSGISYICVFFKGDNVRSMLPLRLVFLEKDTLCHARSLVPFVPPSFCWWQQLSCVPKVTYWVTGTEASRQWIIGKLLARNGDSVTQFWGLFHINLNRTWLSFCVPRKIFSFYTPLFSRNRSSRAAGRCWMLIFVISKVLWAGYARNVVSKHSLNVFCLCKSLCTPYLENYKTFYISIKPTLNQI